MPNFGASAAKLIAPCVVAAVLCACAPRQARIAADTDCASRPIPNAAEAERRATCFLRSVSQACTVGSGSGYRREVMRVDDAWQIRSIAPVASCGTWVVVLSARDGQVIRFESE